MTEKVISVDEIFYFLPFILFLGIITTYEDIRFGKIRNRWTITAIAYSLLAYSFIIIYNLINSALNHIYLLELSVNFIFAILVGYGLWHFRIWSAGDGKLFISFAFLLPLSIYQYGYQPFIPSITLLINIFVISFFLLILFFIFWFITTMPKLKSKHLINIFTKPREILNSIIFLFALNWFASVVLSFIPSSSNSALVIVCTLYLYFLFKNKLGKTASYIAVIISIIRLLTDKSIYSASFVINFGILILIKLFVYQIMGKGISKLGQKLFSKTIHVDKLKKGMVISNLAHIKNKFKDSKIDFNKFFDDYSSEGITKKQIEILKKTGFDYIDIGTTLPFAPFIFFGVILTIILKGSILLAIFNIW